MGENTGHLYFKCFQKAIGYYHDEKINASPYPKFYLKLTYNHDLYEGLSFFVKNLTFVKRSFAFNLFTR